MDSLIWGHGLIEASSRWRVDDGSKIVVYKDRWIPRLTTLKVSSSPNLGENTTVDHLMGLETTTHAVWGCLVFKEIRVSGLFSKVVGGGLCLEDTNSWSQTFISDYLDVNNKHSEEMGCLQHKYETGLRPVEIESDVAVVVGWIVDSQQHDSKFSYKKPLVYEDEISSCGKSFPISCWQNCIEKVKREFNDHKGSSTKGYSLAGGEFLEMIY
ncbi:hypothetical protein Dsin_014076 [Dipteronia sinensis]|uniref:Uncharacterized protein n=1 Tax=Dipteronia sinensis TaxID=43782 RepID=A0AAE0AL19_9ROSI|nr:hypothetical protein Dsin_014076 [Dipteronia sinensis]